MNTTTQDKNLELSITLALRFNTTNGIIEKKELSGRMVLLWISQ